MRTRRWVASTVLIALGVTGMAACSDDDGGSSGGGEVFTDASTPIEVSPGDEFTIELEATPGTGYSWALASPPPDGIVESLGSDFAHRSDDPAPGAAGDQSLGFRAVAAGTATITLNYVRPWEQGVAPSKTESFSVTVT